MKGTVNKNGTEVSQASQWPELRSEYHPELELWSHQD